MLVIGKSKKKYQKQKKQKKKNFKPIIAFKDHKQEKTKTKKIYLQKKISIKTKSTMCKSRKQKRNIGKNRWLSLWNPHNKTYKKTCKIKNYLIIVFINLIKQKIIKLVCFFTKTLWFFNWLYQKNNYNINKNHDQKFVIT